VLNYTPDNHISTRKEHQQVMGRRPSSCILEYVVHIHINILCLSNRQKLLLRAEHISDISDEHRRRKGAEPDSEAI
jgi:hypothetical protein